MLEQIISQRSGIYLILITGSCDREDLARVSEMHNTHLLEKPVDFPELLALVQMIVDEKRTAAASMLAHLGYTAMTCANGEEAIYRYHTAMMSGDPYLCVLMDLTVPCGMGGKDAARHILSFDPDEAVDKR
jgi:CheY-like chemotaxis protein